MYIPIGEYLQICIDCSYLCELDSVVAVPLRSTQTSQEEFGAPTPAN
jgi:hypothetical protein